MKTVTANQLNGEFGETLVKARVMQLGHMRKRPEMRMVAEGEPFGNIQDVEIV
jgi:hypothetical protein